MILASTQYEELKLWKQVAPKSKSLHWMGGSQAELAAIQRTYGSRARTLVGRAATESAFRTLAPEQEIVHLATHGVLNKHNQAHDVPNLFVTDGAAMTSSGCQNPSLTYMAMSARAANYASDLLKAGTI